MSDADPLNSWQACALRAQWLLSQAQVPPALHQHVTSLWQAIATMQASAAAPPAVPPIESAPAAAPASPWAAAGPGASAPAAATPPAMVQPGPVAAAPAEGAPAMVQAGQVAAAPVQAGQVAPAPVQAPPAMVQPGSAAPAPVASPAAGPAATDQPLSVITYGNNERGALAQGFQRGPNWEPAREVTFPAGTAIVAAMASDTLTGFVTQAGELLLAGSNAHYVHTDHVPQGRVAPTVPPGLVGRRVTRAFMYRDSVHLFAFVDGHLCGWGANPKALGMQTKAQRVEPTPLTKLGPHHFEAGVPEDAVGHVALSRGHSLVVLRTGEAFGSGSNSRGQLGFGAPRAPYDTIEFCPPEGVEGVSFAAARCGAQHSVLLSTQGELYSFGQGEFGQLGLPNLQDCYRPTRVETGSIAGRQVRTVDCGAECTFCITEDGQLHGAGSNARGQLGLGDATGANEFVPLPVPGGRTVERIGAGASHTLALCSDGTLFGWGDNTFGQLTPGAKSRYLREPVEIEWFRGRRIVGLAAGKSHTVVSVAG